MEEYDGVNDPDYGQQSGSNQIAYIFFKNKNKKYILFTPMLQKKWSQNNKEVWSIAQKNDADESYSCVSVWHEY